MMQSVTNIPVRMEENSNSKEKAKRLPKMDIQSQQNITATTSAEDVLTEINVIDLKKRYRTIQVNNVILRHRPRTLTALTSEEGILLRMNRSIQVEGVFGVLKEDYGFRRFLARGKKNVKTQFFLLAFALNIEKLCNRTKKGRIGLDLFALNAS